MKKHIFTSLILSIPLLLSAQNPNPALIGYWHNWNDSKAPYIQLDQIDSRYNIINIAFVLPKNGTDYEMVFTPENVSPSALKSQIKTLQSQGKKVLISIGGATAPISLDNEVERDSFISTVNAIISTYGFDGIDIDFEGSSISVSGGTIASPVDEKIINMIAAIKQIMGNFYTQNQSKMMLTMAPETAFVQGGMSAYSGIWGAYLPIIEALRDSIEILHVQLYNSGTMNGIDKNIYTQGTADFIVAMTEAVIQGFSTGGGDYSGLPANKVAIGLPACPIAAGGGYTDTATVKKAIDYLKGTGTKPGNYTLSQSGGYPNLRGMMTWSINWDARSDCASSYEFAANFEKIFLPASAAVYPFKSNLFKIWPNPAQSTITISTNHTNVNSAIISLYNYIGDLIMEYPANRASTMINISDLPFGLYYITYQNSTHRFIKN